MVTSIHKFIAVENIILSSFEDKWYYRERNKDMMVNVGSKLMFHSNHGTYNPHRKDDEFDIQLRDAEEDW
jgi:hypothetical protein